MAAAQIPKLLATLLSGEIQDPNLAKFKDMCDNFRLDTAQFLTECPATNVLDIGYSNLVQQDFDTDRFIEDELVLWKVSSIVNFAAIRVIRRHTAPGDGRVDPTFRQYHMKGFYVFRARLLGKIKSMHAEWDDYNSKDAIPPSQKRISQNDIENFEDDTSFLLSVSRLVFDCHFLLPPDFKDWLDGLNASSNPKALETPIGIDDSTGLVKMTVHGEVLDDWRDPSARDVWYGSEDFQLLSQQMTEVLPGAMQHWDVKHILFKKKMYYN